jgi:hypothetical protein
MPPRRSQRLEKRGFHPESSKPADDIVTDPKPSLLSLPMEIKLMILKEVFHGSEIRLFRTRCFAGVACDSHCNILLTCKTLWEDGVRLFYESSHLKIECAPETSHRTMKAMLKFGKSYIRSVQLLVIDLPRFATDSKKTLCKIFPGLRVLHLPLAYVIFEDEPLKTNFPEGIKMACDEKSNEFCLHLKHKAAWDGFTIVQPIKMEHGTLGSDIEAKFPTLDFNSNQLFVSCRYRSLVQVDDKLRNSIGRDEDHNELDLRRASHHESKLDTFNHL